MILGWLSEQITFSVGLLFAFHPLSLRTTTRNPRSSFYILYSCVCEKFYVILFKTVRPFVGTIQWANEADLCPDTVYLDSIKI